MTDFKTYYNSKFRQDINQFFSTIPDESRFHEDNQSKQTFSVQYERLTPSKNHLDFLSKEEKEYFGVALFFTVLTDMVCFSQYKSYYQKFKSLTRYPKFIGNCPGGCHYHYHPNDIFFAMNKGQEPTQDHLLFYDKFIEAFDTIQNETIEFLKVHLEEIDGEAFWNRCKNEFPYKQT